MAYSAITTPEVAVNAPVSNPLMTKVKDNFDYLKNLERLLPKCFGATGSSTNFNVDSITNDAEGVYTINFITDLTDDDYTVVGSVATASGSQAVITFPLLYTDRFVAKIFRTSDGSAVDPEVFSFTVFQNL